MLHKRQRILISIANDANWSLKKHYSRSELESKYGVCVIDDLVFSGYLSNDLLCKDIPDAVHLSPKGLELASVWQYSDHSWVLSIVASVIALISLAAAVFALL